MFLPPFSGATYATEAFDPPPPADKEEPISEYILYTRRSEYMKVVNYYKVEGKYIMYREADLIRYNDFHAGFIAKRLVPLLYEDIEKEPGKFESFSLLYYDEVQNHLFIYDKSVGYWRGEDDFFRVIE